MHLQRRLEAVATADRRHFQVQRRVPRVAALLDHVLGGLLFHPDLHQLLLISVVFPEVAAKPAPEASQAASV